jgi:hypothetical protein
MSGQRPRWFNDIDTELLRAQQAEREGNAGRVRACARRIAGIALSQTGAFSGDAVAMLRTAMTDDRLPETVRAASARLQERTHADFSSALKDPVGDAMAIVHYCKEHNGAF